MSDAPPPDEPTASSPDPELTGALTGESWAGRGRATDRPRRRRISPERRRRQRRQRRAGWLMIGLGLLIVVTAAWVAITALIARSHLTAMRGELTTLRAQITAGQIPQARATARHLADDAHAAHNLTTGPAWAVTAAIPSAGDPFASARGVAKAADELGQNAVPQLIDVTGRLDPATLRTSSDTFDVSTIATATPAIDAALASSRQALATVNGLPQHTWLGSVDSGRTQVAAALTKLTGTLGGADDAAHVLPTMLGQQGTQRYFVGFINEAEMRGLGGIAGAFGILEADHGKLTFTHFGADSELSAVHDADVDLGSSFDQHYADWTPTKTYINSTSTPNFGSVAQIWAAMWQKKSGQRVDGAISVDPTALSYLLAVTGPARLADGTQVTAANVVTLTESTAYQKFASDNLARKQFLLDIARGVDATVLGSRSNPTALVKAAGRAGSERRILVWSRDPQVEARLAGTTIGGAVPETTAPFFGPVVQTAAAGKLEFYLTRDLSWVRTGCGPMRTVTVTMKLTNTAPANVPPYVRVTNTTLAPNPGDSALWLNYFGTAGGGLRSITVDGRASGVTQSTEAGHPAYTMFFALPRGRTTTVVLTLTEPAGTGAPVVLDQPGVHPATLHVQDNSCS